MVRWCWLLLCACGVPVEGGDTETDTEADATGSMTSVAPTSPSDPTAMSTSSSATTMSTMSTTDTTTDEPTTTEATTAAGCRGDDECSAPTAHCNDDGECVECTEHAHCESSACDLGAGTCFEGDAIAVAVGYGFRRVRTDDGIEWDDFQELNPDGGDDNDLLRGVGYGDGVFVAVGGGGMGRSIRSNDGIEWTDENTTIPSFLSDVVWIDGAFVAAGGNGLRLRSMDGGATWGDQAPYIAGHFRGIATDGEVVVAVGHTYGTPEDTGMWSSTSDGVSWTPEETDGPLFHAIAWGGGTFVAVGANGRVSSSADGSSWDDQNLGGEFFAVAYAGDEFIVGADGTLWSSPDGTTWTEVDNADSRPVTAQFMGGYFSLGWPASIDRSDDLVAYEPVFAPGGSGFTDIAVGVPGV